MRRPCSLNGMYRLVVLSDGNVATSGFKFGSGAGLETSGEVLDILAARRAVGKAPNRLQTSNSILLGPFQSL